MGSSSKKKSKRKTKENEDDGNIQDERFQIAQTHPQFQKLHTKRTNRDDKEVQGNLLLGISGQTSNKNNEGEKGIDDRFKAVLTDSRFAMGGDIGVKEGGVDKYGRKQKKKKKKKDEKESPAESKSSNEDDEQIEKKLESGSDSGSDSEDENEKGEILNEDPESRIAYLKALSRGEIDLSSSDEDSSDGDDDDNSSDDDSRSSDEDSIYGKAGVLDPSHDEEKELELTFDESRFMAVCNTDWTNVRAVDLLAVISSFSPPGAVKFVHVYPSDFGMERMKKDKMFGPVGVWKKKDVPDDNSDEIVNQSSDDEDDEERNASSDVDEEQTEQDEDNDDTDESVDIDHELDEKYDHFKESNNNQDKVDSDFDSEKLRAYEAAKLKYFFAVVEFISSGAADVAYKELDGMEMGHSSTNLDLRSIPEADVGDVIKGRECRDKASVLPSNYTPPDFVVSALQQTAVKCTWEQGDKERERLLTQYGVGNEAWSAMAEGDDLKAYLASDASSGEEDSSDDEQKRKGSNMRKLLGLADSDDDDGSDGSDDLLVDRSGEAIADDDDDSFFGDGDNPASDNSDDEGGEGSKSFTYIPGKHDLQAKIRTKLKDKKEDKKIETELSPWEKYQLKRKEKRKEKKKRNKETKMTFQGKHVENSDSDSDDISTDNTKNKKKKQSKKHQEKASQNKAPSSKEELDLLLAGDNVEEEAKDFHMRDLMRIDKNKSKKLRGSRKRKEEEVAASTSGLGFKVDTSDDRFAAVLEGADQRFGIDRTDPQYKETPAMREILAEQTKRRKKGRKRRKKDIVADVNADAVGQSSGALALSSLVKSLKTKVAKK